jgi:organic radical activating enzyme
MKANIAEVFKSVQGEGIYFGKEQIFVRFWGCNLDCAYCDTRPQNYRQMDADQLCGEIAACGSSHSVAITGGEPLVQSEFLRGFLKRLKAAGHTVYLESNGVLHQNLEDVIDYVDIIAMDYKLPEVTAGPDYHYEHELFLRAASAREIFVKAVIGPSVTFRGFRKVIMLIAGLDKDIPLIIQPQHPHEDELAEIAADLRRKAAAYLSSVKVIPQMHKMMGVR